MRKYVALALSLSMSYFSSLLIKTVYAEGKSMGERLLSSPLVILVAMVVIDIIAFIYHKIRK
jgi:hypothetical protein